MLHKENIRHKIVFIIASVVALFVIDLNWVYPPLFDYLPQVFGWVIGSALVGFEIILIMAEWRYLESEPIPNIFDSINRNRRRYRNLKSDL